MPSPVFFHAGAGRAGSTWLQKRVFPKLQGVRYIRRRQFRRSPKIIARGGNKPFLVSRQLGYLDFGPAVEWFSRAVPHARPILVVRRHDDWLRSVYLREIKELRYVPFEEFVDLERDRGVRPQSAARFRDRIQLLEDRFEHRPLVLFFDDLTADPAGFAKMIGEYAGAVCDPGDISLDPVNPSYSDRQYRFLREAGRIGLAARRRSDRPASAGSPLFANSAAGWFGTRSRRLAWHVGLGLGRIVPERLLGPEAVVTAGQLDDVRRFYKDDWSACLRYARATARAAGCAAADRDARG